MLNIVHFRPWLTFCRKDIQVVVRDLGHAGHHLLHICGELVTHDNVQVCVVAGNSNKLLVTFESNANSLALACRNPYQ